MPYEDPRWIQTILHHMSRPMGSRLDGIETQTSWLEMTIQGLARGPGPEMPITGRDWSEGRIGTRRDWILKDIANAEVTGRATTFPSHHFVPMCYRFSKWVMMNTQDGYRKFLMFCPKEPRQKLEENPHTRRSGQPRRADLDMNHHVNNVTYIGWLLEVSVIIRAYSRDCRHARTSIQVITLDYRRECQQDDVVDSLTTSKNGSATSGTQSHNDSQFLHLLRLFGDGQEINHGTTLWRKKPSR
ncbi:hypothetical protein YC2023_054489 [Brassica napus]